MEHRRLSFPWPWSPVIVLPASPCILPQRLPWLACSPGAQATRPMMLCWGDSCLFVHSQRRVVPIVCCLPSVTSEFFTS